MKLYSEDVTLIRRALGALDRKLTSGSRAAYAGEIEHIRWLDEKLKGVKVPDGPRAYPRQQRSKRITSVPAVTEADRT